MAFVHPRIQDDFEDITLSDVRSSKSSHLSAKMSRHSGFRESMNSSSGESSMEEHQLSYPSIFSNMSTPTLTSDTSSVRSSSGASSPRTPPSISFSNRKAAASTPDLQQQMIKNRQASLGRQNSLIDTTSMASLTIRHQTRGPRSRKQREQELDLDNDDEIWPRDDVMFNVPMSPALYAQQKNRMLLQKQTFREPVYDANDPRNRSQCMMNAQPPHFRNQDQFPNVYASNAMPASMSNHSLHISPTSELHVAKRGDRHAQPDENIDNTDYSSNCSSECAPECTDNHNLVSPSRPQGKDSVASIQSTIRSTNTITPPQMPRNGLRSSVSSIPASIRSVDYDDSLSELGSDAFDLTMDLYRHEEKRADQIRRASAVSKQDSNKSRDSFANSLEIAKSRDSLQPPGSICSDEDCNSRRSSLTRPENLPPKSPEEERKHLKTYEKMLRDSVAAHKKKMQKQELEMKKRNQQAEADLTVWQSWLNKGGASRLPSELVWRGISTRLRGDVWKMRMKLDVKNAPKLNNKPFQREISADSELIWPECGIFGINRPLHDSLLRTSQTVFSYFKELPYKPAITWLCAVVLLHLEENESVAMVLTLLKKGSLPNAVLFGNEQCASANYVSFQRRMSSGFPHLAKSFAKNGVTNNDILNPLMEGLFANILPNPEAAARVIDLYTFTDDHILLSAALGLIKQNEAWLYGSKLEVLNQIKHPRLMDDESFVNDIRGFAK